MILRFAQNDKRQYAFTLSELLMALTIVGVIAVLTVPVIMNNIQNRIFVTKLKNTVAMIEQLAQQELIKHRTRDLSNTDFSDPNKLLTDKHFAITKRCSNSTSSKNCWRVTYKKLNGSTYSFTNGETAVLKNGVIFRYNKAESSINKTGDIVGSFVIDINGNDKPNIVGRDLWGVYINNKGKIVDYYYSQKSSNKPLNVRISDCKTGTGSLGHKCFGALLANNWKMDY